MSETLGVSDAIWSPRFHWKLRAPAFTGRRGRNELGIPLGKGTLPNLDAANMEPRETLGHVITGAGSGGAALFVTTWK